MVGRSKRRSVEICGSGAAGVFTVARNRSGAVSLSRRCIFGPWPVEAKILQLRCNREEIIFSLRRLNETYIENNSSQPRKLGERVSNAIPAGISRSASRSGIAYRRRRSRAGEVAAAGRGGRAHPLV